ncbi:hypothetical protein L1887_54049 [Cichorium endivia]|nr:hypothetical protein L1887_54049 [Cichorium endivia]
MAGGCLGARGCEQVPAWGVPGWGGGAGCAAGSRYDGRDLKLRSLCGRSYAFARIGGGGEGGETPVRIGDGRLLGPAYGSCGTKRRVGVGIDGVDAGRDTLVRDCGGCGRRGRVVGGECEACGALVGGACGARIGWVGGVGVMKRRAIVVSVLVEGVGGWIAVRLSAFKVGDGVGRSEADEGRSGAQACSAGLRLGVVGRCQGSVEGTHGCATKGGGAWVVAEGIADMRDLVASRVEACSSRSRAEAGVFVFDLGAKVLDGVGAARHGAECGLKPSDDV